MGNLKILIHKRGQMNRKITMINNKKQRMIRRNHVLLNIYCKNLELHYQQYAAALREGLADLDDEVRGAGRNAKFLRHAKLWVESKLNAVEALAL